MKFNPFRTPGGKYRTLSIIAVTFIGAIALLYFFVQDPDAKDPEYNRYLIENEQFEEIDNQYFRQIKQDSTNIELYRTLVLEHFAIPKKNMSVKYTTERDDITLYQFLLQKIDSGDSTLRDLGLYGLGLYFLEQNLYQNAQESFSFVNNRNLKYLNNSIGFCLLQEGKLDLSEPYFLKEIENNGNKEGAYKNLIDANLAQHDLSQLDQLIKKGGKSFFTYSQLTEYYRLSGKVVLYLLLLIINPFLNLGFFHFLGALFITLIWIFYLRKLDVFEPEKWKFLILIFGISALLTPFTLIVYDFVNNQLHFNLNGSFFNDLIYCILGIGLIEESIKLIPLLILLKFTKQINEPIDYIIYASISALGFAFIENMSYFGGYGLELIHGRGLISVVIHMICSSMIGYGISIGFDHQKKFYIRLILSLLIASAAHGIFDFWLISKTFSVLFFLSFFVFIAAVSVWNTIINNAINFSIPENSDLSRLNLKRIQNYLMLGLSGLLLVEFVLISIQFGPTIGRSQLVDSIFQGSYLIIFLSSSMSSFKFRRNKKGRITPEFIEQQPEINQRYEFVYHSAQKYDIFPCSGVITEQKMINHDENWYLVQLDKPIENYEVCNDHVMIQLLKVFKTENDDPLSDSVMIAGIFMIKDIQVLLNPRIKREDLYFCAWVKLNEILTS
jgi:RsiW-degrading membrane proteinase PrsW (M82 family)